MDRGPTGIGFQGTPAIEITKFVDNPILGDDGVAVFTITVTNPRPADLVDVVVTDAVAVSADVLSTTVTTSAVLGQALPSTGIGSDRIAFVGGLLLAVGLLLVALTATALRSQRSRLR